MSKKGWLYLIVALVCVVGLLVSGCAKLGEPGAPGEEEVDYVSFKVPLTGETVRFERGAWVEGMKSGEEDLYIEWYISNLSLPWMVEEIWRRSKGHWKLKTHPKGILAIPSQEPDLIGAGLYDMGRCEITYFPSKFPLANLTALPFWSPDNPAQFININHYTLNHPLVQQNYARLNLFNMGLPLGATSQDTIQLVRGVKEVNKQADFEGLMIRASGYWSCFARANGMIPADIPLMEIYSVMKEAIVDVNIASALSVRRVHLYVVCDRIIKDGIGSTPAISAANMDKYNELPQYLKDLWWELITLEHERTAAKAEASLDEVWAFLAEQGMTVYTLPEEEWREVQATAYTVYEQWIEDTGRYEGGKRIREYARDCEAYREKITGKPNPIGFVP